MHSESETSSYSSPLHTQLNPEVLSRLAEKLQATAHALLHLTRELEESDPDHPLNTHFKETPEPDQIRRFLVPGFIVRQERELLRQCRADNLVEVLKMARDDFTLTSMFMRGFHDDLEVDGPTIQHIGESLARPLRLLKTACALFTDFELQPTASEK